MSDDLVTRIVYSDHLNIGKYNALKEQAARLGAVRSLVWQQYGSIIGLKETSRTIRDRWLADGTAKTFNTLANSWKETVRDVIGDIHANQASAKEKVQRAISRLSISDAEKKQLYITLKYDGWFTDPYLHRQMRKYCHRGKNHTHNQIVVRSDNYDTRIEHGRCWLSVPGLIRRKTIRIPLNTTVKPTGTLRLILRDGRVEVHYQILASSIWSSLTSAGTRTIGIDKGYTEVLVDSDGNYHGEGFGELMTAESDYRNEKGKRRNKIRSVAKKAEKRGNHGKAQRIRDNNLGTKKWNTRKRKFETQAKTMVYEAVHAIVDKAAIVVSEDLTSPIASNRGKVQNRRLNSWRKGVIAQAVQDVTRRRGSSSRLVNAAYTSQVDPRNSALAHRSGGKLYCSDGVVFADDYAGALNVLLRLYDTEITRYMSRREVYAVVMERTKRHRLDTA